MNLLPKSFQEFRELEYWNKFFKQTQNRPFEWYGDYNQLCAILHKYIKIKDDILVIGCGNSKLSADLYDVGLQRITNIDISPVVIKAMIETHRRQRPLMNWHKMDVTKMEFKDDKYSVVLDKGTLDALLTNTSDSVIQQIDEMFTEISRVLRFGGRFICVSLLQRHILDTVLKWFRSRGWMVRICRRLAEDEGEEIQSENPRQKINFPVFVIVCTKFKAGTGFEPILEAALDSDIPVRMDENHLKQSIAALQQFAILRFQISKGTVSEEDVSLNLYDAKSSSWRYALYVVDLNKTLASKFAIFIVPHGRESQWLFNSPQGRRQLAETAQFERLVVVHLNRDHIYENLETIKSELSSKVMELAPPGLNRKTMVPFLSIGDDLGKRIPVHRGFSDISGDFIVEDVEGEDTQWFRRLIFASNPNAIQSEARLMSSQPRKRNKKSNKKENTKKLIDYGYLACQHHKYIVGCFAFLRALEEYLVRPTRVLIVGLGGGGLPSFLHQAFKDAVIDVVEIDSAIADVAKDWFGFSVGQSLSTIVADGMTYIADAVTRGITYDLVILDADSKDSTVGMSCPPKSFLEPSNLLNCKNILSQPGVFVLNLVCRDSHLRKESINKLKDVFPQLYRVQVDQEVNEIMYGLSSSQNRDTFIKRLNDMLSNLEEEIYTLFKNSDNFFDTREFNKSLEIL